MAKMPVVNYTTLFFDDVCFWAGVRLKAVESQVPVRNGQAYHSTREYRPETTRIKIN